MKSSKRKLCEPNRLKWPKISDEEEGKIRDEIGRIFRLYRACLKRSIIKVTTSENNDRKNEKHDHLTPAEIKTRGAFKSTFVIGFNAVIRKLEQHKLRLVLMDRSTNPGVLKRAILSMAVQNRCPALLVADLLSAIHESWPGLKSCTCLAVLESSSSNDFDGLVNIVQKLDLLPKHDKEMTTGGNTCDANIIQLDASTKPKSNENTRPTDGKDKGTQSNEGIKVIGESAAESKVKPVRPTIDFTKYYIPAKEKTAEKKFEGQSFICFGEEAEDEIVVFRNGLRVTDERNKDRLSYGIHPVCMNRMREQIRGVKRKHSDSSGTKKGYKSISLQQLKPNDKKVKKKKKQKPKSK